LNESDVAIAIENTFLEIMNPANDPITADVLLRASALFDHYVELAPTQRDTLLCEERLQPEVETLLRKMLAADARIDDPFATPAVIWAAQLYVDPDTVDGLIGQCIGGFRILSRLGQGGSSVVFAAERDVAGAKQQVALKLLQTGLFSAEAQRRFRREQAILTGLTHPNIARLIDAGVSTAGIPYIAMERIDGQTLMKDARTRRLDLPARLRLVITVALAVDAAHRALVVHRDLKPDNILVDAEGHVKVLDFGIAKLIDANDSESAQTQQIALTPGYAAPEQYGHSPPTTAVDIYALGVIAAELAIDARLGPDARLPSGPEADAQRLRWRALDSDLATVLRTALAEEPLRRYASARHFADDIERYLAREPIAAHPLSRTYRARKFISRHRIGLAIATAMVAMLLGAFALVLTQRDLARQQAARADSMRDFMFTAFAEAEPGSARDGPATVLDAVRRAIKASDADPKSDPAARFELRLRLAQVLQRQGDLSGARGLFEEVQKSASERWGASSAMAVEAATLIVENSMASGEFALARAQLDGLPKTNDARQRLERLSQSAVLASRVRDLDRALRDGEAALVLARQIGDPELVRVTLNDWGVVLIAALRVDAAIETYQELLTLNRARFGERHVKVGNVQAALSRAYRRSGDLDRALAAAQAAVEIDRTVYPGDDRHAAVNLNALMLVLRERGDLDQALTVAREALRINIAVLSEGHPDIALARFGVGDLLMSREDFAEAAVLLGQSTNENAREFGPAHWRTAGARAHYGFALGMSGSMDAGVAALEQAIEALRSLPTADPDRLCAAIERRARLAQHAGDSATAMQWLDRLLTADLDAPPTRACWLGNVELRRAAVVLDAGRLTDANAALRRAGAMIERVATEVPILAAEHSVLRALLLQRTDSSAAIAAKSHAEDLLAKLRTLPPALRDRVSAMRAARNMASPHQP
jgi:eukaryotic-like serine/threonine-protein kinase